MYGQVYQTTPSLWQKAQATEPPDVPCLGIQSLSRPNSNSVALFQNSIDFIQNPRALNYGSPISASRRFHTASLFAMNMSSIIISIRPQDLSGSMDFTTQPEVTVEKLFYSDWNLNLKLKDLTLLFYFHTYSKTWKDPQSSTYIISPIIVIFGTSAKNKKRTPLYFFSPDR